jgi:DNA-binding XRE family transcriptional regulator
VNKPYKKQLSDFSSRVKKLRKARHLTQRELAAKMDVDERTIKNLESGIYNSSLLIMFSLAEALKVKVSELFN